MFNHGPFTFERAGRPRTINGAARQGWRLSYGQEILAEKTLTADATRPEVVEHFDSALADFRSRARAEHAPDVVHLVDFETGEAVAAIECATDPGLTPGIVDDRSRYWLRSADRLRSRDVTLQQFAEIVERHAAPENSWIAGLLPDHVLTTDMGEWRPPTSWEIRHIVGEGSLVGRSGAMCAALVGMSPQNFRKYLARDEASARQSISFSAWHLLLHRLSIQSPSKERSL